MKNSKERAAAVTALKLIKAYKEQAQEQALILARWRVKLEVLEGDLLKLIESDLNGEVAQAELKDLMS